MPIELPDRISAYAIATEGDLGCVAIKQVRDSKLCMFWVATVYEQMVCPEGRELYCATPKEAFENASLFVEQCAAIVSERRVSGEKRG